MRVYTQGSRDFLISRSFIYLGKSHLCKMLTFQSFFIMKVKKQNLSLLAQLCKSQPKLEMLQKKKKVIFKMIYFRILFKSFFYQFLLARRGRTMSTSLANQREPSWQIFFEWKKSFSKKGHFWNTILLLNLAYDLNVCRYLETFKKSIW